MNAKNELILGHFQILSVLAEIFFLVVFKKLIFPAKISAKTDKIKNFDQKLKNMSQNLYRKKIPIRSEFFFFRMLQNLDGDYK
jgi:hypothetical protein